MKLIAALTLRVVFTITGIVTDDTEFENNGATRCVRVAKITTHRVA